MADCWESRTIRLRVNDAHSLSDAVRLGGETKYYGTPSVSRKRTEIVKLYYSFGESATAALRGCKTKHGLIKDSFTMSTITRLIAKFESTGSVLDFSVKGRKSLSDERAPIVQNAVEQLQSRSTMASSSITQVSQGVTFHSSEKQKGLGNLSWTGHSYTHGNLFVGIIVSNSTMCQPTKSRSTETSAPPPRQHATKGGVMQRLLYLMGKRRNYTEENAAFIGTLSITGKAPKSPFGPLRPYINLKFSSMTQLPHPTENH
ncbi:hypothetical protein T265_04821 [Opisthorchis viverrini]|uniref:DUF4817 domain-containing protein n=1 Tax=Opisthorchis viverrini TaxID=6198 RepID=A0A074ZYA3_OPIVI|nr:hypothetical protein T265_04821 [Opisthorchis viverrini]KER28285.1 hypothetical protein T265_04821 [Opisthorchis viverrini]